MIKLENISETYDLGVNRVCALNNINLSIRQVSNEEIFNPYQARDRLNIRLGKEEMQL